VNYILEEEEGKNVLTSAAKEVIARADLLQAAQYIADSWRPFRTGFLLRF
jgi:hypothetical protein